MWTPHVLWEKLAPQAFVTWDKVPLHETIGCTLGMLLHIPTRIKTKNSIYYIFVTLKIDSNPDRCCPDSMKYDVTDYCHIYNIFVYILSSYFMKSGMILNAYDYHHIMQVVPILYTLVLYVSYLVSFYLCEKVQLYCD